MSTKETVRQKLRGEERFFSCRYPFTYKGHKIEEGQILGPLPEDVWLELAGPRYYRYGQIGGGIVKVQEMEDGFPKVSFTGRTYIEGERFYKVRFLQNTTCIPKDYCCRLRMSDIREFTNRVRYQNDAPLPAHLQLALVICEDRVKPDISPEVAQERAAAIEAGLASQNRPSWLQPALVEMPKA
jgi:hypothetical protein